MHSVFYHLNLILNLNYSTVRAVIKGLSVNLKGSFWLFSNRALLSYLYHHDVTTQKISVPLFLLSHLQWNAGVVLLQVLQADLQVQLSCSGDNVLSRLLNDALHHGIRLGQALQALHQLGQVSGVLGLHSNSDDRTHTELHHPHVVGLQTEPESLS